MAASTGHHALDEILLGLPPLLLLVRDEHSAFAELLSRYFLAQGLGVGDRLLVVGSSADFARLRLFAPEQRLIGGGGAAAASMEPLRIAVRYQGDIERARAAGARLALSFNMARQRELRRGADFAACRWEDLPGVLSAPDVLSRLWQVEGEEGEGEGGGGGSPRGVRVLMPQLGAEASAALGVQLRALRAVREAQRRGRALAVCALLSRHADASFASAFRHLADAVVRVDGGHRKKAEKEALGAHDAVVVVEKRPRAPKPFAVSLRPMSGDAFTLHRRRNGITLKEICNSNPETIMTEAKPPAPTTPDANPILDW